MKNDLPEFFVGIRSVSDHLHAENKLISKQLPLHKFFDFGYFQRSSFEDSHAGCSVANNRAYRLPKKVVGCTLIKTPLNFERRLNPNILIILQREDRTIGNSRSAPHESISFFKICK